ncbi:MAG: hypothetical protein KDE55_00805 [Novosphingobium sp.]|nr:hypothetical protein [Novosphingobium sp.]
MERQGEEIHVSTAEASAGETPHIVRYVLFFGLILAILAMSAIWITGALSSPVETGGIADSQRAAAQMEE